MRFSVIWYTGEDTYLEKKNYINPLLLMVHMHAIKSSDKVYAILFGKDVVRPFLICHLMPFILNRSTFIGYMVMDRIINNSHMQS